MFGAACQTTLEVLPFQHSSHLDTLPPIHTKLLLLLWSSWNASTAMSRISHEVCFSFSCAVCQRSNVALLCQCNSVTQGFICRHRAARKEKVKKKPPKMIPLGQKHSINTNWTLKEWINSCRMFIWIFTEDRPLELRFDGLLTCFLFYISVIIQVSFAALAIPDGAPVVAAVRPPGRLVFRLHPRSRCSGL